MLSQKDKEIEVLQEYHNNNTTAIEESHRLGAEILRLKSIVESISQEKVHLYIVYYLFYLN